MNSLKTTVIFIALLMVLSVPAFGQTTVATMNPDGTNQTSILSIAGPGYAKWSDDMSMIVFTAVDQSEPLTGRGEIFIVNSDGSSLQQLTDYGYHYGQTRARFHGPSKIWWTSSQGTGYSEIYEMNLDGSGKTRLTHFHDQGKEVARFDFCGTKVYYKKQNSSWSPTGEIYSANLDFTGEVQLTFNSKSDALSDVSPDCTKLLMARAEASNGYGPPMNIYQLHLDGSGTEDRLTSESGGVYCYFGTYSPDGNQIVYFIDDGTQSDIWIMDVNGNNKHNITNTPEYNEYPQDWRDGRILYTTDGPIDICSRIIFSNGTLAYPDSLHTMGSDGSDTTTIPTPPKSMFGRWSPDMIKIAFTSWGTPTGSSEIHIMNADGTGVNQLTHYGYPSLGNAVSRFRSADKLWWYHAGPNISRGELFEMNTDGTDKRALSDFWSEGLEFSYYDINDSIIVFLLNNLNSYSSAELYVTEIGTDALGRDSILWNNRTPLTSNTVYDCYPDISPDGTQILFVRQNAFGGADIYAMDIDGTNEIDLTNDGSTAYNGFPIWSEDGDQIIYGRNDGIQKHVYKMNADGSNKTNLTPWANPGGAIPWDWRGSCETSDPPVAAFSADPVSGCAPLEVNFTDESTGDITSWEWYFGDGFTSTDQNPLHEYLAEGTYTVALTVTGPGGNDSETKVDYITLINTGSINGFVTAEGSGLLGVPVDLYDGDGTAIASTSTDETGWYEFPAVNNGLYTVVIEPPLGFITGEPAKEIQISGLSHEVNFELEQGQQDKLRHVWWWKAYLADLRVDGPRLDQFTENDINNWCMSIFDHFYTRNDDYAIQIENVTYIGDPPQAIDYDDLCYIMLDDTDRSYASHVRRNLLANLLNVASNKMSQLAVVSEDGVTASQAITYFADLYLENMEQNNFEERNNLILAYLNLRKMHMGTMIPAGIIPLATPNVMFKPEDEIRATLNNLPIEFTLSQNHPNPFNPVTQISFSLPQACDISIDIYNIMGQKVTTLANGTYEAGQHTVEWDSRGSNGNPTASGIYFYRLKTDKFVETKKMLLLK